LLLSIKVFIFPKPTPTETQTPTETPLTTPTDTPTPTISLTPTATPTLVPPPVFSSATFSYDGDGKRVKSVLTTNLGSTTTYFVGNHYEVSNGVVTKYHYAGTQRIAMRQNGDLFFITGDHLGSTSLVTDSNGAVISEVKYKAWGETHYSSGTEQTKYTYTGQYSYVGDFGLQYYNARWYDDSLGRFAQADTIVPSGSQGLDRYAYTFNNPIRYTDPSGHIPVDCLEKGYCGQSAKDTKAVLNSVLTPAQVFAPKPANTLVIIVCGRNVTCSTGNQGSLDEFEHLGEVHRIEFNGWYEGIKYEKSDEILNLFSSGRSIIIVGHSAGADAIVLALEKMNETQKSQVRGIVLIDPSLSASAHNPPRPGEVTRGNVGDLVPVITGLNKNAITTPPLFIFDSDQDTYKHNGQLNYESANYSYVYEPGYNHMDIASAGGAGEYVYTLAVNALGIE